MFQHHFTILPEETDHLVDELRAELPPPYTGIEAGVEAITGESVVRISTNNPLSLKQRRFLNNCGFDVTSEYGD